jgi:hypothetical protein
MLGFCYLFFEDKKGYELDQLVLPHVFFPHFPYNVVFVLCCPEFRQRHSANRANMFKAL